MSVLDLDATALAEKIERGEITSTQAAAEYISHLEELNPSVNCLVEKRFEEARLEAGKCDDLLRKGKVQETQEAKGRLFGVPISMKEAFDVAGMKTTGGLIHRNKKLARDAEIVSRLKSEGAIILGKTNTPTLCFCQETDNKLYGRTNNPWDLARTAGGSSGGEGALMAMGGAAVGIGSDIGGSIRFPAHFNGVIGFKSGNSQVSDDGAYPPFTDPLQTRMLGIGAMAKSVRDARLINEIIATDQPAKKNLADFTVTIPDQQLVYPASDRTRQLLGEVKAYIGKNQMTLDEQPPMYRESALFWQLIMSIDGASNVAKEAFAARPANIYREWVQELFLQNSEWHRNLTWALIGSNMFKPSAAKLDQVRETVQSGDYLVQTYLQDKLLILPVYHSPAPLHGKLYAEIFSVRKTYLKYMPFIAYPNVWGLPSLTIPVGEEDALPVGIQVISALGNEDAIFQLGEQIEQGFRGWKRAQPSGF